MATNAQIEEIVSEAYKKYKNKLIRETSIVLIDKSYIEDCIQEAFIVFQKKLLETDGILENSYGFLKTVARNIAVNYNREKIKYIATDDFSKVPDRNTDNQSEEEQKSEALALLYEIMDDISPRARSAIICHHALNRSLSQTACIIGSSESATQKLMYRTIKTIRQTYKEKIGE
ncbi:MAG: sigma-70 family RNA polymerase sigma factor [Oscillospiraceae bacterium]|nr:sigma-70 family RNA polymerase sigma factor [Oscillospiraceae bacterium]